jgi:YidC/Oxa1 family membrane protein insertase
MSPPANPGDQSAMMTNMMNVYMPLLMGYLAYTLASGLALYFLMSNIIGILQYAMLGRLNWKNVLPSFKAASSTGTTPTNKAKAKAK